MPRIKRLYRILTFQTTTQAMAFEKMCNVHNIPGRLIPVPREITAGCGLSWRIPAEEYTCYQSQIRSQGLYYEENLELMVR